MLLNGLRKSRKLLKRVRPAVVIGFGGYPTFPPAVAARTARLPIIVHEQNAVVGRANRLLLRLGAILATGFKDPNGAKRALSSVYVGNPVRKAIILAVRPYEKPASTLFRLLVFGGSQGAHVFSDLIPAALALLPEQSRWRVMVVQQARSEDLQSTRGAFERIHVDAEVETFFSNMGERIADSHLVICRAGASTVAELAAIGRPAILVPYPHALDHDQAENARVLAEAGGGWLIAERDLTPAVLARRLDQLMESPDDLVKAAAAAHAEGRLDAAERLADLVESVAKARGTL
jgi:UDP-N-acetylglucosamine--N-acetylmuramyl-(pentapeptide) pyrophosphoryl-undecaprenol N-acetylglucosamine transferase